MFFFFMFYQTECVFMAKGFDSKLAIIDTLPEGSLKPVAGICSRLLRV